MMKKLAIAIGIIGILFGMSTATAFAADQQCTTCSATSPLIDNYINFSYELIQTLKTIANEKIQSANQTSSQNAGGDLLNRIANNLNQKGQTAMTFSVLTATIGTQLIPSVARQELMVMTNAKSLQRDWEKLDKLDQAISDTLFELGQAGAFISNTSDYQQRVKAIYDKYGKSNDSFMKEIGDPTTSASTLVSALWDMNQATKRFIAGGNTDGFDVFNDKYKSNLGIIFNDQLYSDLALQYSCARGINKCDATYKKFGQNMGAIFKDAQKQTKEAVKTITTSLERLKCAFSKQSNVKCQKAGFTEKQNDLLRGLYGIEGPMSNQKGSVAIANSMDRLGDSLASQMNDVKDFYTKNDNPATTAISSIRKADLNVGNPDVNVQRSAEDLYVDLLNSVNMTMSQSKQGRHQHALADPLVVTRNIPRMSIMLYNSVNIIGDGQTAKSITQNLGKACENQCVNKGGTCYY